MNTNQILRSSILVGLFAALFIPFIISDSLLFPFITGKAFTFRILVEILFGVWLVVIFRDPSIRPRFSWFVVSTSVFVVVIALADIFGANFFRSFWSSFERMEGLITLLHLLAYFFIAGSVINTREKWSAFFNTSVFVSFVMSIYVFLQLAGEIKINQGGVRVDGTFGNATYLAVFMLLNFFLTLFLLVRSYKDSNSKDNWALWAWYGLCMLFQVISIYFTATRGDILGLIVGVVTTTIIVAIFGKTDKKIRKISIAALLSVVILIGGFLLIRNTEFVRSSQTLNRFATLTAEEISKQGRWYVWPMAIQGFKDRPLLGWGQENFTYVFNQYYDPRMYDQEPWFDRAHNVVLDWLVAGGILGLGAYLSMFAVLVWALYKSPRFSLIEKAVLFGLVVAYFFQNLFVFDNLVSYIYFFTLLAFIHSETSRERVSPAWINKLSENNYFRNYAAPVFGMMVAVASVYCFNVKPISAGRDLIHALQAIEVSPVQSVSYFEKTFAHDTLGNAEAAQQMFTNYQRIMSQNIDPVLKDRYAEIALKEMTNQTIDFPMDARYQLFLGTLQNRLARHQDALVSLEEALKLSPKKQSIIFEIGLAHLSLGEYQSALNEFKKAYNLEPSYADAGVMYAIGALYAKDNVLVDQILSSLPEEKIATDERLLSAFVDTGNATRAVKAMEKRAEIMPESLDTRFRLAAGYLLVNNRTKSIEVLRQIVVDFPEARDQAEYYINEIRAGRNP